MRCHVELIGRLSQDPDIRTFPNGDRFAFLTIETEEAWRDKATGERKLRTTWHVVRVAKAGIVKAIERQVSAGALVFVAGTLRYSEWTDKEQVRRRTAEVLIKASEHQVLFLNADARPA